MLLKAMLFFTVLHFITGWLKSILYFIPIPEKLKSILLQLNRGNDKETKQEDKRPEK